MHIFKRPSLVGVGFLTTNKDTQFELVTGDIWPIHPKTGNAASWADLTEFYPGIAIPIRADVAGQSDTRRIRRGSEDTARLSRLTTSISDAVFFEN
jgi:hypothetical protein